VFDSLALYRRTVDVNPDSRPQAFEEVEALAEITYRPRWRLYFQKKPMPEKTLRDVCKILNYEIDAETNRSHVLTVPPLEYQDPEEALAETTALLINDASAFVYLQRS